MPQVCKKCAAHADARNTGVVVLRLFAPMLPEWPNLSAMSEEDRVFIVASTLAVCWFLRGGEFLWSPKSDPGSLSGLYWRLK